MKLKRILTVTLAALLLLTASGCQLAREDLAGGEIQGDKLIGVFVTEEHLDLFDIERYVSDNYGKMNIGGNNVIGGDTSAYENRLYAALVSRTLISEETGEPSEMLEYVFEGVEGYSFFMPTITDPETGDSYRSQSSDGAISDAKVALASHGEDEDITLEGTIYYPIILNNGNFNFAAYVNPVYQSLDGSVYALAGDGISSGGNAGTGGKFTYTLDNSTTVTENGTEKTMSASISISVAAMFPPEKIVIAQLDEASAIVSRKEYEPGTLPYELSVDDGTEYIIVETHSLDENGEPLVGREMYNSADDSATGFTSFYCREDGICAQKYTALNWGN